MVNYDDYKLGFEIEFKEAHRERLVTHMQNYLQGSGIQIESEHYNHTTRSHWKIVYDGTVSCGSFGGELVSPVLQGGAGLEELRKVLEALNSFTEVNIGENINYECGVHVHLSYDGMNVSHVKNIYRRYAHYEDTIDTWFPKSRRANSNRWCKTIQDNRVLQRIANYSDSLVRMSRLVGTRYVKLNLQSLSRHGTIEFRQHAGSTDFEKISNWAKFCMSFVDISKFRNTETMNINYRRQNRTKSFGEVREIFESKNWSVKYGGGVWKFRDELGHVRHSLTNDDMFNFYIGDFINDQGLAKMRVPQVLNINFINFYNSCFTDNQIEDVFDGCENSVKEFLQARIAYFAQRENSNREVA